jgi:hypothetical protein
VTMATPTAAPSGEASFTTEALLQDHVRTHGATEEEREQLMQRQAERRP